MLLDRLEETREAWKPFLSDEPREAAVSRFRKYAYQWY
jgi:hypothetical protein